MALVIGTLMSVSGGASRADLTEISSFSASGTNPASTNSVSATATFYYNSSSPDTLVIDLVNTTTGISGQLGGSDVLTGLAFNIKGSPSYSTSQSSNLTPSLTLDGGNGATSTILVNQSGNSSFTDTWTNDITPGGNSNVTGSYGISTNGFNGAFKGGVGGPNNGIVNTSDVAGITGKGKGIFPLAENGLEFSLMFKTSVASMNFSDVQFLFGTEGTGVLDGPVATPEPSTLVMVALGALGFISYGLRRRIK